MSHFLQENRKKRSKVLQTYETILKNQEEIEDFLKKVDHLKSLAERAKVQVLLNERETASLLSVSAKWLQSQRYIGNPPRYYKIRENIRYNLFDLLDFLDSCLTTSTSQNSQFPEKRISTR